MSDNVKVFEQYSLKTKPKSASEQDNQPEYRAIGLDKTNDRQSRLRIHYVDGTVDVFTYAHLLEISCTDEEHLLLCFSNCMLMLEGTHMEELIEPLQDEKVRYLVCFNKNYYAQPEADAVIIENITRQNLNELMRP